MKTSVGTVTVKTLSVEMTSDEWRHMLGEPAQFMSEIRRKLSELQADEKGVREKKRPKAAAGTGERVECPICHETFSPRGIGSHKSRMHKAKTVPGIARDAGSPMTSSTLGLGSTVVGAS